VIEAPQDLDARAAMQLGASLAGLGSRNSMLGAAHALANPLTQHFGIPHGRRWSLMLPHVVRHNGLTQMASTASFGRCWGTPEVSPAADRADRDAAGSERSPRGSMASSSARLQSKLAVCGVPGDRLPD